MAAELLEALATVVFVTWPSGVLAVALVLAFFGRLSFELAKESMC